MDEYSIRYTNKFGLGCTLVVYAETMTEARQKADEELGDYLVRINEIRNVSLARQLINEVE